MSRPHQDPTLNSLHMLVTLTKATSQDSPTASAINVCGVTQDLVRTSDTKMESIMRQILLPVYRCFLFYMMVFELH